MYPYNYITEEEVTQVVDNVESVYLVKSILHPNTEKESKLFEAILLSLSFLRDNFHINYKIRSFVDCMGSCCEATLYASTFNFDMLRSIEIVPEGVSKARNMLKLLPHLKGKVELFYGTMRDYFPTDFDIFFLDCCSFKNSMLDEGIIIELYFKLCRSVLAGSYGILLTQMQSFDPIKDFGTNHVEIILTTILRPGTSDESMLSLYKFVTPTN